MPHCQKENHNHTAKSKKERQKKKEALQARKKAAKTGEEEELEKGPNNLALADGFGEYIVGCEEERKFQARFNMNKRSKKVRLIKKSVDYEALLNEDFPCCMYIMQS